MVPEEEFINWIIEKRLDLLSEQKKKCEQDEILDAIEEILGLSMPISERLKIGMLLDRIRWEEGEIYKEGFKDGIRVARRLYDISAYQGSGNMNAA